MTLLSNSQNCVNAEGNELEDCVVELPSETLIVDLMEIAVSQVELLASHSCNPANTESQPGQTCSIHLYDDLAISIAMSYFATTTLAAAANPCELIDTASLATQSSSITSMSAASACETPSPPSLPSPPKTPDLPNVPDLGSLEDVCGEIYSKGATTNAELATGSACNPDASVVFDLANQALDLVYASADIVLGIVGGTTPCGGDTDWMSTQRQTQSAQVPCEGGVPVDPDQLTEVIGSVIDLAVGTIEFITEQSPCDGDSGGPSWIEYTSSYSAVNPGSDCGVEEPPSDLTFCSVVDYFYTSTPLQGQNECSDPIEPAQQLPGTIVDFINEQSPCHDQSGGVYCGIGLGPGLAGHLSDAACVDGGGFHPLLSPYQYDPEGHCDGTGLGAMPLQQALDSQCAYIGPSDPCSTQICAESTSNVVCQQVSHCAESTGICANLPSEFETIFAPIFDDGQDDYEGSRKTGGSVGDTVQPIPTSGNHILQTNKAGGEWELSIQPSNLGLRPPTVAEFADTRTNVAYGSGTQSASNSEVLEFSLSWGDEGIFSQPSSYTGSNPAPGNYRNGEAYPPSPSPLSHSHEQLPSVQRNVCIAMDALLKLNTLASLGVTGLAFVFGTPLAGVAVGVITLGGGAIAGWALDKACEPVLDPNEEENAGKYVAAGDYNVCKGSCGTGNTRWDGHVSVGGLLDVTSKTILDGSIELPFEYGTDPIGKGWYEQVSAMKSADRDFRSKAYAAHHTFAPEIQPAQTTITFSLPIVKEAVDLVGESAILLKSNSDQTILISDELDTIWVVCEPHCATGGTLVIIESPGDGIVSAQGKSPELVFTGDAGQATITIGGVSLKGFTLDGRLGGTE